MTETRNRVSLGAGFRNLWIATLASNLGDGIARVAIPLLAARLTDDPLLISGIAALAMLPWLLFAIPAGIASTGWTGAACWRWLRPSGSGCRCC